MIGIYGKKDYCQSCVHWPLPFEAAHFGQKNFIMFYLLKNGSDTMEERPITNQYKVEKRMRIIYRHCQCHQRCCEWWMWRHVTLPRLPDCRQYFFRCHVLRHDSSSFLQGEKSQLFPDWLAVFRTTIRFATPSENLVSWDERSSHKQIVPITWNKHQFQGWKYWFLRLTELGNFGFHENLPEIFLKKEVFDSKYYTQ